MLILGAGTPVTANSLFEQAKAEHLKLGMATIYRTLEMLEELGLMQRLHDGKGCHGYLPDDSRGGLQPPVRSEPNAGRLRGRPYA